MKGHHRKGLLPARLFGLKAGKKTFLSAGTVLFILSGALAIVIMMAAVNGDAPQEVANREESQATKRNDVVVIVVLGEKLLPSGKPSRNLESRIAVAKGAVSSLFDDQQDVVPVRHVILSGGDTARIHKTEASVMRDLWQKQTGLRLLPSASSQVIELQLEQESLSTCENAFYSATILSRLGATTVEVVTSDYHAPRAKLLFEQVFATLQLKFDVATTYTSPTLESDGRASLFENERNWLKPHMLEKLLTNMSGHPFDLPTGERIERARNELSEGL